MILTGPEIEKRYKGNEINIKPFNAENVTTNSYDLSLSPNYIRYKPGVIDPKTSPEYDTLEIPEQGLLLNKGDFVLGSSNEIIGSDHFVPLIHAKSGIARMGLFVHVTADLIDIGSHGNITFQLYATLPVKIYKHMKIAQVTFWAPQGDIKLYEGKYQGSQGPQVSKIYMDHNE